jgi:hypothetical protein
MEKWFCLAADGLIYVLGTFDNYDDADEEAIRRHLDVIWLFGEESARSWQDTLNSPEAQF